MKSESSFSWGLLSLVTASLLLLVFMPSRAEAFPNVIAHGYPTCATCHYNPSGGGSLTSYGKFIAQEIMGTFNEAEEALPWLIKPDPEAKFVASVLLRGAQTYFDTARVKRAAFRRMQADLEIGYATPEGWQAIMALGPQLDAGLDGSGSASSVLTRRAWVGKVARTYAVRVGKFFPEYGLYFPNHNIPTRKGLYFNHGQEPYIAQGSYFGDKQDLTLALMEGARDTQIEGKRGYAATWAVRHSTYRVGLSRLDVQDSDGRSHSSGFFGQVGIMKLGNILFEFDEKKDQNGLGHKQRTQVGHLESGWSVAKGVIPFVSYSYQRNFQSDYTVRTPQVGVQWLPITHTEVVGQWGPSFVSVRGQGQRGSQALLMLNVYF